MGFWRAFAELFEKRTVACPRCDGRVREILMWVDMVYYCPRCMGSMDEDEFELRWRAESAGRR